VDGAVEKGQKLGATKPQQGTLLIISPFAVVFIYVFIIVYLLFSVSHFFFKESFAAFAGAQEVR